LVVVPGQLARVQMPIVSSPPMRSDTGQTAEPVATVTGVVFDSVSWTPLSDALVQMQPRAESVNTMIYSARTDSAGRYRIENLPRGRYTGTFFHPALAALGMQAAIWSVDVGDSVVHVTYAVPSPEAIWAGRCPLESTNDSTGLLLGHVHDADTNAPLAESVVTVRWNQLVMDQRHLRREERELTAPTNQYGFFALCGVPADHAVLVRAEHGAASSGAIEVEVPLHGLLQRDLGIGTAGAATVATADSNDTASPAPGAAEHRRGTARLEGIVRSAAGDPMRDVDLAVRESDERVTSGADGRFALSQLPSGTYTLEARHVGFAPTRVSVDLASHRATTVAVTLEKQATVLNEVTVYGTPSHTRSASGFAERRQLGFGHFFTRADIARRHPIVLSDLFRGAAAGIQVVPTESGFGHKVILRGGSTALTAAAAGCQPTIYLDGMLLRGEGDGDVDWFADPQDVTGVEIYTGPEQTPPQYPGGGCGSVVIWTNFHVRD
jgi:hypothetical protein